MASLVRKTPHLSNTKKLVGFGGMGLDKEGIFFTPHLWAESR